MPTNRTSPWLTPTEAAELLGVGRGTAVRWCRTGKLPAEQTGSRRWFIARADVVALLDQADR